MTRKCRAPPHLICALPVSRSTHQRDCANIGRGETSMASCEDNRRSEEVATLDAEAAQLRGKFLDPTSPSWMTHPSFVLPSLPFVAIGRPQRCLPGDSDLEQKSAVRYNLVIPKTYIISIDSLGVELKLPMFLHRLLQARVRVPFDAQF